MDWLFVSIDPTRSHEIGIAVAWHGRLMVLAWAFLFPIGILIARFLKITPKQDWPNQLDNQIWWHSHWILQSLGGIAVAVAAYLIWASQGTSLVARIHHLAGWLVIGGCTFQIVSGLLRGSKGGPTDLRPDGSMRGDHFDMTLRRRIFERVHKSLGYGAILLAWVTTFLGLWLANAPVWMFVGLAVWFLSVMATYGFLQGRGLAFDTYQAIWGTDPDLPGNRNKPIGIGVRRWSK